jgi:hypothetical protein
LNLKLEKKSNLILDEFIRSIGEGFYLCEFGYFAHYVIGINYIPNDSRKKVLNDFLWNNNKGKIIERACNDKIKVKWRYSGTERIITNA